MKHLIMLVARSLAKLVAGLAVSSFVVHCIKHIRREVIAMKTGVHTPSGKEYYLQRLEELKQKRLARKTRNEARMQARMRGQSQEQEIIYEMREEDWVELPLLS